MTEKEAIEIINDVTWKDFGRHPDFPEARDMAKAALEKQIAKKPNYIGPWFECSNCKKRIGIPNYTINLNAHEYCHHCGQRIDWSETL